VVATGNAEWWPTPEDVSERAQQIYLGSWEESFSVEHLMAAENELLHEHAQRKAAVEASAAYDRSVARKQRVSNHWPCIPRILLGLRTVTRSRLAAPRRCLRDQSGADDGHREGG
jgi:hypothetical protein